MPAEVAAARSLLRRLAAAVGGDLVAAEPARILRIPRSHNHKYDPPRPVRVLRFDAAVRVDVHDFDDWLPPVLEPLTPATPTIDLAAPIGPGARNDQLYKLGRRLNGSGVAPPVLRETLQLVNERLCTPPLDPAEVDRLAQHVTSQPHRDGRAATRALEPVPPGAGDVGFAARVATEVDRERVRREARRQLELEALRAVPGVTLPSHTPAEIAALAPPTAGPLAPYVFLGTLTELTGYLKRGKSSFLLYVIGCLVHGVDCLEQRTQHSGVFLLSEEKPPTLTAALARTGLLNAPHLRIVSRATLPAGLPWAAVVAAAVAECLERGFRVLVVDTLGEWAGLKGEEENHAGAALAAVEPLQRAAAAGLAVVVTRHDRKSGGAVGEAGRGSSAYAGCMDTLVNLRKPEGAAPAGRRVLEALSRFDGVPESVLIERRVADSECPSTTCWEFEKNLYRALGAPGAVAAAEAEAAVLGLVTAAEETGITADAARQKLPEMAEITVRRALTALVKAERLDRSGKGTKGDAYVYRRRTFSNAYQTPNTGTPGILFGDGGEG